MSSKTYNPFIVFLLVLFFRFLSAFEYNQVSMSVLETYPYLYAGIPKDEALVSSRDLHVIDIREYERMAVKDT